MGNAKADAAANAATVAPASSDGWTTVHKESAAVVIFNEPGDTFTGTYQGEEHVQPGTEPDPENDFDRFRFLGESDGKPYAINESYTLREAMTKVKDGELCRITYVKEIPTKRSLSPLKDFRVDVKRS